MRRYGTFIGLVIGIAAIFGSFFFEGGSVRALFLLPPLIVVFGGTFATAIIGSGWERFSGAWVYVKVAVLPRPYDPLELVDRLVQFSIRARKEGLLSLESEVKLIEHPQLRRWMQLAIDGTDTDSIRMIAEGELQHMAQRHSINAGLFSKMGGYAPTMGIIGTVMGLIMTLASAGEDPNALIHNMASAFIATLWGIFSANIIWLPVSDRLKLCHLEEKQYLEILLEGVLAIQQGEVSNILRAKLMSSLPANRAE
ncbi:MAG TPA: MotA/TolQ/ExbB proton channel family protein [Bacteroidota bacterium]|nr:MotA/TolQ/ExbB proton channel family protein [Bacteroidota bacterium]